MVPHVGLHAGKGSLEALPQFLCLLPLGSRQAGRRLLQMQIGESATQDNERMAGRSGPSVIS